MPTATTAHAPSDRTLTAIGALTAVAMVAMLVTPRATWATLALLALAIGLAGGAAAGLGSVRRPALPVALLLALAAWAAMSTAWAADRPEAIVKSIVTAALILTAAWSLDALKSAQADLVRHAGRMALIVFAACLLYLCVEEITDHLIKRVLFQALPFTRPDIKHVVDADHNLIVSGYISNRNMAVVALAIWPMLLIARTLVDRSRLLPAVGALVVLTIVTMSLASHETSIIALLFSAVVLGICAVRPKLGLGLLAAGWLIATLFVVPIVTFAARGAELYNATWLPNSARHRIVLWDYTAEQVASRPVTGIGAASTKLTNTLRGPRVAPLPGTNYEWRSGPHAHNVYLQTWYELGAVGALLLSAAGLALIAALSRLPANSLPFAAATLTSAAVIASFSWGMWQEWFLALFAVAAVLMGLAAQLARSSGQNDAPPAATTS